MCEKLSYQTINIFTVIQAIFCYYQMFAKIIEKKESISVEHRKYTLFKLVKGSVARTICVNFGKFEFLIIHIFNWYKALIQHAVVFLGTLILLEQFE